MIKVSRLLEATNAAGFQELRRNESLERGERRTSSCGLLPGRVGHVAEVLRGSSHRGHGASASDHGGVRAVHEGSWGESGCVGKIAASYICKDKADAKRKISDKLAGQVFEMYEGTTFKGLYVEGTRIKATLAYLGGTNWDLQQVPERPTYTLKPYNQMVTASRILSCITLDGAEPKYNL